MLRHPSGTGYALAMSAMGEAARTAAKKVSTAVAVLGMAVAFAGCAATTAAPSDAGSTEVVEQVAPDLVGEWKQSNSEDPERWQVATVAAGAITISWIADGGDTKALYWAGSAEVPDGAGQSFSWESVNDTSQTENSLLASDSPTKTFTYSDEQISYEVSAMGVTKTVKLERQP